MILANFFDGRSARLHPVELATNGGLLLVSGAVVREYAYADVRMAEPFDNSPCVLDFADGARCEVAGPEARQALAAALGYRPSRVERWQQHWYGVLLALVLLIAAGAAFTIWGIPAAAEHIAASIPPSLDKTLGETTLKEMEQRMLQPSRLSDERIAEVQQVFRSILPARPRMPVRLLVRSSQMLKANALALPDGTIVITDAMVLHILGDQTELGPEQSGMLAGVLAHEVGHVQGRHSVRVMARSSLTAAASAAMFGDFSAVAAGLPAVLMNMHYSRDMESDADGYAIDALRQRGISPVLLGKLFDSLEAASRASPERAMPSWMRVSADYVSSHPPSAERAARFRRAAAAP